MRITCWLIFCSPFLLFSQVRFTDISEEVAAYDIKTGESWGSGVTAEDFDEDGDIDIVLCADISSQSILLRNTLIENGVQGEFGFEKIAFDLEFNARVGIWIDYDGDHLLDLLFTGDCLEVEGDCDQTLALYQQNPNGTFTDRTGRAGLGGEPFAENGPMSGVTVGDMNDDGFLDVIVPFFNRETLYLTNLGDGRFQKSRNDFGRGRKKDWTPVLFDLDQDGWLDYYQAVDLGWPNELWIHKGDLVYEESASQFGIDHQSDDMGVAIGDYNLDGHLDIYVTNIENEVKGNILLENDGQFSFTNVAYDVGVAAGGWGWGVTFMDANNDGWLDIAATNGFDEYDQSKFWLSDGAGLFNDISEEAAFNDTLMATSLISLDLDRDGDLDMIQTFKSQFHEQGFKFLRNELERTENQNYLVVKPRMRGTNHWAIGSLVKIRTGDTEQMRPITAGISYFAQEPAEAFFGLGSVDQIDEIEIVWPGGSSTSISAVAANQVIEVFDDDAVHPPRNLTLSVVDEQVQLSWDQGSTNATGYTLERAMTNEFETPNQIDLPVDQLSYTDGDVELGETYYYRVKSKDEDWLSRSSRHIPVTITQEIAKPTDISTQNISLTAVNISWTDQSDKEIGYLIQRSAQEDFANYLEFELPADSEAFLDENLEPFATYYYRLQAFGEFGVSGFTELIEVRSSPVLNIDDGHELLIHPNPSQGIVYLKGDIAKYGRLRIYSIEGTLVYESVPRKENDLKSLSSGTYFVLIGDESTWEVTKLIIN